MPQLTEKEATLQRIQAEMKDALGRLRQAREEYAASTTTEERNERRDAPEFWLGYHAALKVALEIVRDMNDGGNYA